MKALDEIGYHGWAIAEPAWWPKGVALPERLKQVSEKVGEILAL
jgi:hexulose-6-phosphate isomerase